MYKFIIVVSLYSIFLWMKGTANSDSPIVSKVLLNKHIFEVNNINNCKIIEYPIHPQIEYKEARIYLALNSENPSLLSLADRNKIKNILKIFSYDRKTFVFESDFPPVGGVSFPIIQSGSIIEIWSKGLAKGLWTTDVGIIYYKDSLFTSSIQRKELILFQERFFALYDHEKKNKYLYGSWQDLPTTSILALQIGFDGGSYLNSLITESAEIVFMDGEVLKREKTLEYISEISRTQFVYLTKLNYLSNPVIKIYDNYGIIEREIEIYGMDPLGGICNKQGKYFCQLQVQIFNGRLKSTCIKFRKI